jgi:hypothetical protein
MNNVFKGFVVFSFNCDKRYKCIMNNVFKGFEVFSITCNKKVVEILFFFCFGKK